MSEIMSLILMCGLYRKSTLKVLKKISFLYIPAHITSNLHEVKINLIQKQATVAKTGTYNKT